MKHILIFLAIVALLLASCSKDNLPNPIKVEHTTKDLWFSLQPGHGFYVNIQAFSDRVAIVKYIHPENGQWHIYTAHVSPDGTFTNFVASVQQNSKVPAYDTVVTFRNIPYAISSK